MSDSSAVIFEVLFSTYSLGWKLNSSSFFQYLVRTAQINISDFFPILTCKQKLSYFPKSCKPKLDKLK